MGKYSTYKKEISDKLLSEKTTMCNDNSQLDNNKSYRIIELPPRTLNKAGQEYYDNHKKEIKKSRVKRAIINGCLATLTATAITSTMISGVNHFKNKNTQIRIDELKSEKANEIVLNKNYIDWLNSQKELYYNQLKNNEINYKEFTNKIDYLNSIDFTLENCENFTNSQNNSEIQSLIKQDKQNKTNTNNSFTAETISLFITSVLAPITAVGILDDKYKRTKERIELNRVYDQMGLTD